MRQACDHAASIQPVPAPRDVCEACIVEGTRWVHLRQCLVCGQTLCCNNSPRRHMSAHWDSVGHPVMRTRRPASDWTWCFPHDAPIRAPPTAAGRPTTLRRGRSAAAWPPTSRAAASPPRPDFVTDDDFPLGDWARVRARRPRGGRPRPGRRRGDRGDPAAGAGRPAAGDGRAAGVRRGPRADEVRRLRRPGRDVPPDSRGARRGRS